MSCQEHADNPAKRLDPWLNIYLGLAGQNLMLAPFLAWQSGEDSRPSYAFQGAERTGWRFDSVTGQVYYIVDGQRLAPMEHLAGASLYLVRRWY